MISDFVYPCVCIQTRMCLPSIHTHTDDATRVKLLEGPDYINANYVNVSMTPVLCWTAYYAN